METGVKSLALLVVPAQLRIVSLRYRYEPFAMVASQEKSGYSSSRSPTPQPFCLVFCFGLALYLCLRCVCCCVWLPFFCFFSHTRCNFRTHVQFLQFLQTVFTRALIVLVARAGVCVFFASCGVCIRLLLPISFRPLLFHPGRTTIVSALLEDGADQAPKRERRRRRSGLRGASGGVRAVEGRLVRGD